MMNIPLTFEVLLYLNSYYFGLFSVCEICMNIVKYVNRNGDIDRFETDFSILTSVCVIEIFRVILAQRGNLTEKKWTVFLALLLTIPSAAGVIYLIFLQTEVLRFEYILCTIQLSMELMEIGTGILVLLPFCKTPQYY
ncbi:hypothetical protein WA026_016516 [Henosepilachna vigintioctopunctata]|uniref:Transmembrane protein 216 n=1 Tax=Henosepilachna vigintioctopunctata TaxID=420089 RepID=A0AAW1VDD2_9CUCU